MTISSKYLLVVGGPTAAGKTSLAIALARHFATEIISADSRQFYREMSIGNARPSEEELSQVKHHLIAHRNLTNALSAGAFAREAHAVLDQIYETKDYAVVVGGSGLFIRALTEGLDEFPEVPETTRQQVTQLFEAEGIVGLQLALEKADPAYYQEVDLQNPVRLQRALEVCWSTGKPYSSFRQGLASERSFTPIYLQPSWSREELYQRINLRVEQMLAAGLEEEARKLMPQQELPALQTVGYQEWWPYFEGKKTKEEVIELIQQNSRRYAKRQLTWNRRDGYWKHIPRGDLRTALAYIELARKEGFIITKLFKEKDSPMVSSKEDQKRLCLQSITAEEVVGIADLSILKDWALVTCWFGKNASHLAKTLLLHEACQRTEKSVVYLRAGYLPARFMRANGWTSAGSKTIPRSLREKWPEAVFWQWARERQVL